MLAKITLLTRLSLCVRLCVCVCMCVCVLYVCMYLCVRVRVRVCVVRLEYGDRGDSEEGGAQSGGGMMAVPVRVPFSRYFRL